MTSNKLQVPALPELEGKNAQEAYAMLGTHEVIARIDRVNWPGEYPYAPKTEVRMAHTDDKLYIRYNVQGRDLRAMAGEDQGEVWCDSCVEFFCQTAGDDHYLNFETNCIGRMVASRRKSRTEDVVPFAPEQMATIDRYSTVGAAPFDTREGEFEWGVCIAIPLALIVGETPIIFPLQLRGNLYKCADRTPSAHFVSWKPIGTAHPDFHCPQWFGDIELQQQLAGIVTSNQWDKAKIRRAIIWLCEQTGKPILKLTNKDYNDNGLGELVTLYDSAYDCNIRVFNDIQHTITGWPGGKPNTDDSDRPERRFPYPKDVLIFSPHPDDDVISMGGTFQRLIKQGHNVHVAYETSGCIAVDDTNLQYYLDFMNGYARALGLPAEPTEQRQLSSYTPRQILDLKALIRRGEATAADRYMGLPEDHIHFLNLPFYETGTIQKGDLSQADVDIVKDLLQQLRPQQMFVAGDLADPHGTHKVCFDAVLAAIDQLKDSEAWLHECRVWMYRGAWMEWEPDQIEMAVPISPEELRQKRNTILKHQSQMESAPFLGADERLFWQRAEDRNHATAELYARLGLANYEAIEAFVQYPIYS